MSGLYKSVSMQKIKTVTFSQLESVEESCCHLCGNQTTAVTKSLGFRFVLSFVFVFVLQ